MLTLQVYENIVYTTSSFSLQETTRSPELTADKKANDILVIIYLTICHICHILKVD